jgi:hypothetical protein
MTAFVEPIHSIKRIASAFGRPAAVARRRRPGPLDGLTRATGTKQIRSTREPVDPTVRAEPLGENRRE